MAVVSVHRAFTATLPVASRSQFCALQPRFIGLADRSIARRSWSTSFISNVPHSLTAVPKATSKVARRQASLSTMAPHDIETFGKAALGTGQPSSVRGDCPFSQRIYIDLEEKNLPYKATYIQEGPNDQKPKWFMEHNPSGLMPVLRHGDTWIQDSDKIADYLEKTFPEPALKTPEEFKQVGGGILPTFTQWLRAKDAGSKEKAAFEMELHSLNSHLESKGPFIAGEKYTESDSALAPKLYHARVSLKHYYGYEFPSNLSGLHEYMKKVEGRKSFQNTSYPEDMIVEGWKVKFQLPGPMIPLSA